MFIAYLIYKKSWIGLIALLLLLTNALIGFDAGFDLEPSSIIYLNLLFIVISLSFFIWRYKKETAYYKSLLNIIEDVDDKWFEAVPSPNGPFPEATVYRLLKAIHEHEQRKGLKHDSIQEMDHNDLASWVHELKTPLTAMKITLDANPSNDLAQRLNASWLRMHLLIDQQLYISRLDKLDSDLLPEKQQVKDLIREEVRELSVWCMEKNISIELTGDMESSVYTDKKWCGFVIRQILTNAIKYSPEDGSISIDIEGTEDESIIVRIMDEGPGIGAHDLPRVFDKGFTGEMGRSQHCATGMGLYLAKKISDKLHIGLELNSTVGEGTSVSMIFSSENPFERVRRTLL